MPQFVRLQLLLLVVSMVVPAACMILRLTSSLDPLLLSNVALVFLLVCWILALLTPALFSGGADRTSRRISFIAAWSAIAIFFPLAWDLPWAIFHEWVRGATADDAAQWFFWAYAVADTRFLRSDHLMIIVEYGSGVIAVLEIAFAVLLWRNRVSRAIRVFLVASSFQFYGCAVFFLSQVLDGFASIRPDFLSYLKFFGLNGMWVIFPALSGIMLVRLARDPEFDATSAIRSLLSAAPAGNSAAPDQLAGSAR